MKYSILTLLLFVTLVFWLNHKSKKWANSIKNPRNKEFVVETAFNLNIPVDSVTQAQFDERYN